MTEFPDLLTKLHNLKFDYNEEGSMEFESYQSFMSREDTSEWLKLWTGNKQADASSLLVFGQDGSGGYTAFWLVNQGNEILEQPIVFLGSEGEISVVSKDFNDYLWLLSQNCGPMEVVYSNEYIPKTNEIFLDFAKENSRSPFRSVSTIISDAQNSYSSFKNWIESIIR